MKFSKEFNYAFLVAFLFVFVLILNSFVENVRLHMFMSLLSILIGSFLIVLGFWGSDFAFAMALGHLDQSKEKGKVKGVKKKVVVPFMKNYTPLEWWNLNWFITLFGCVLLSFGMLVLGIVFGVYIFS